MKVEITETQETKQEVEIEFPYYYKHNLYMDKSDTISYGKISKTEHVSIQEDDKYMDDEFEYRIEKGSHFPYEVGYLSCYIEKKEYKGSKNEFEAVKKRAIEFIYAL